MTPVAAIREIAPIPRQVVGPVVINDLVTEGITLQSLSLVSKTSSFLNAPLLRKSTLIGRVRWRRV